MSREKKAKKPPFLSNEEFEQVVDEGVNASIVAVLIGVPVILVVLAILNFAIGVHVGYPWIWWAVSVFIISVMAYRVGTIAGRRDGKAEAAQEASGAIAMLLNQATRGPLTAQSFREAYRRVGIPPLGGLDNWTPYDAAASPE
jgi:hypothetical protein